MRQLRTSRWWLPALVGLCAGALDAAPAKLSDIVATGRCMVRRDMHQSIRLAATVPGSTREARELGFAKPLLDACLGKAGLPSTDEIRFQVLGAIAEAARMKVSTINGFDPAQMDVVGYSEAKLRRSRNLPREAAVIDCVVARDPRSTERLLGTRIGSPAENSAIDMLMTVVPRCVAQGEQVRLRRDRVRAIVARVLLSDGFRDDLLPVE